MLFISRKLPNLSCLPLFLIAFVLIGCDGGNKPSSVRGVPTSIAITPASTSLTKGETTGLAAIGNYADGTFADISHTVEWKSAQPATAKVERATGTVTGISIGTTTITATLNGVTSAPAQFSVTAATLTDITVSTVANPIAQDETATFSAIGTYSDNTTANISNRVIWNSEHHSVATIDEHGLATGVSAGSSLITAKLGKIVSTATPLTVAYAVGGTLRGLALGNSITLTNNGSDKIKLATNGAFSFPTRLASGSSYKLSIATLPAKQPCTQLYGAGKVQRARVPGLDIFCGFPPRGEMVKSASLLIARRDHTLTLLPNGKVLATGGVGAKDNLASAELFDPSTESWSVTGALALARRGHTATLLADGKVLVAGGLDTAFTRLSSVELYDMTAAHWTATGQLSTARSQHTATLLPNGKVLVTGGVGALGTGTLASSELYDPNTGQWTATGKLSAARSQHTAILLPSGNVLVSGGVAAAKAGTLASTEIYDPLTGQWAATGDLAIARSQHSTTLLPNGQVLAAGGIGTTGSLASAELFNSDKGRWIPAGNLASMRYLHTATLLPTGKVLVTGGVGATGTDQLANSELYDPETRRWIVTSSLLMGRTQHATSLLSDGRLLVTGGAGKGVLADSELYW